MMHFPFVLLMLIWKILLVYTGQVQQNPSSYMCTNCDVNLLYFIIFLMIACTYCIEFTWDVHYLEMLSKSHILLVHIQDSFIVMLSLTAKLRLYHQSEAKSFRHIKYRYKTTKEYRDLFGSNSGTNVRNKYVYKGQT